MKIYLVLSKYEHGGGWSIDAAFETLKEAEITALAILKELHPIDIKVIKDMQLKLVSTIGDN